MATQPITYRVSDEVDEQLRKLAKQYGGIDKALRVLLHTLKLQEAQGRIGVATDLDVVVYECDTVPKSGLPLRIRQQREREFKGPLLKPGEKK